MADRDNRQPNYPLVEGVLNAIAGWINKYRNAVGVHQAHGACGPDDVMQIAKDLGVPANQMRDLQRLCTTCGEQKRRAHELARGTAAEHFHDYCPNAFTLDALFDLKDRPTRH